MRSADHHPAVAIRSTAVIEKLADRERAPSPAVQAQRHRQADLIEEYGAERNSVPIPDKKLQRFIHKAVSNSTLSSARGVFQDKPEEETTRVAMARDGAISPIFRGESAAEETP